jgi:hypothetical protein
LLLKALLFSNEELESPCSFWTLSVALEVLERSLQPLGLTDIRKQSSYTPESSSKLLLLQMSSITTFFVSNNPSILFPFLFGKILIKDIH